VVLAEIDPRNTVCATKILWGSRPRLPFVEVDHRTFFREVDSPQVATPKPNANGVAPRSRGRLRHKKIHLSPVVPRKPSELVTLSIPGEY
jgi:hypothetical protein